MNKYGWAELQSMRACKVQIKIVLLKTASVSHTEDYDQSLLPRFQN